MPYQLFDLTQTLTEATPPYPGDSPFISEQTRFFEADGYVAHEIVAGMHLGTHIDVPMHTVDDKRYIREFPPECFFGKGVMLDVRNEKSIDYKKEYEALIQAGDIVILYTGCNIHDASYFSSHPLITEAFADFLIQSKVKILGMDMPSPDKPPFPIHKKLLSHDILILENLTNLASLVGVNHFYVSAFPLKINAEGSLVRAIAITGELP